MSTPLRWRKSSRTESANCVELAWAGAIRDSKHTTPVLRADLARFIATVKSGSLDLQP
jgi:hypothetical protein